MDVEVVDLEQRAVPRLATRRTASPRVQSMADVAVALLLLLTGMHLVLWRTTMLDEIGPAGWALFAVEAITVVWAVLTGFLFIGRTTADRIAPAPDPHMTLDVLIPVAGEPVDVVAATIEAAKSIDWPARIIVCNDGWMAGKSNWRQIEQLCADSGVECLTRTTGAKGKAGNLNHALPHTRADAILTLDADHIVDPRVAHEMLGWLRHDEVAFACTPQQFVGSDRDDLNPTDPIFYRAVQPARDRHGLAFSTGNGVIYRREAIVRVGGFSEWSVVEDLHTSIRLHAAGWKSVFHPRPVSVGLAPATAAEYAKQRARWATDSLRILRHDPPWRRRELGFRAKLHYAHTLMSYLVAIVGLGFLLGPPAWVFGRLSLMTSEGSLAGQLLHIGPWLGALGLTLLWWGGGIGALRSIRLATALLPVIYVSAVLRTFTPRKSRGTVTSKGHQDRYNPTLIAALAFPFLLLATLVWGVVDQRDGGSDLAMGWAAMLLIVTVGPMLRFGYRRIWAALIQTVAIGTALTLTAGAVAVTRFAWEPPGHLYASFAPVDPTMADATIETNEFGDNVIVGPAIPAESAATPIFEGIRADDEESIVRVVAGDGIYVGFTSDPLPHDLGDADRWASEVTEPQIVHWYQQWGSGDSRFRGDWLDEVREAGRVPMVSWEAWAKPAGSFHQAEQELGNMAAIADGDYDDYIDEWAIAAAEYGDPIMLRPFHEMNGFWYPWSIDVNGNTNETYIAGWRHVVDRFRAAGADNVSFVWSINTLASFEEGRGVEDAYPGDDYVDWVATSGFNWDDYAEWASWSEAEQVFGETYELLATFDKPIMFAEIGTGKNVGDESAWVADAMDWFETLPELKAIVWFDRSYDGNIDFTLVGDQQRAIADAIDRRGSSFAPAVEYTRHPAEERALGD